MKKMLDELKKLDVEYKVPANFKENVIKKIREIESEENKKKGSNRLVKYVIPSFASVAVILIACIVTIGGGLASKSTSDMAANQSAMMDASISKGNSEINNTPSFAENLNDMFVAADESLNEKDDSVQSVDSVEVEKVVNDVNYATSAMPESTKENFSTDRAFQTTITEITTILSKANVNIVEISNDYIVVQSNVEIINTLLEDKENIIISETNEGIKIEIF